MQKIFYSQNQIEEIAHQIVAKSKSKNLCFYGQMGAGKTTLIRALVKNLGAEGSANSPTFGIVNEYHRVNGDVLGYHFDFYRLNNETEALDLGFEEYLNQNAWVFIEWPEMINSLLPEERTEIHIKIVDELHREIKVKLVNG